MSDQNEEIKALEAKVTMNELRARDAEARLRIVSAEIEIIEKRKILRDAKM